MVFSMKATAALLMMWSLPFLVVQPPVTVESGQAAVSVAQEDYSLYDRVIEDKFLTPEIQLVLLERMTVSRLVPDRYGWYRRQGQEWKLFDTEVVWTMPE